MIKYKNIEAEETEDFWNFLTVLDKETDCMMYEPGERTIRSSLEELESRTAVGVFRRGGEGEGRQRLYLQGCEIQPEEAGLRFDPGHRLPGLPVGNRCLPHLDRRKKVDPLPHGAKIGDLAIAVLHRHLRGLIAHRTHFSVRLGRIDRGRLRGGGRRAFPVRPLVTRRKQHKRCDDDAK